MSSVTHPISLVGLNALPVEISRQPLFYRNYPVTAGVHLRWDVERSLVFPRDANSLRFFYIERYNAAPNIIKSIYNRNSIEETYQYLNEQVNNRYTRIATIVLGHNAILMESKLDIFNNAAELKSIYRPNIIQLSTYLQQLLMRQNETPMHLQTFSTENKGRVGMRLPILNGMMMAALDPFVAASLGLYYIDRTPPPTGVNIYRVTGSWGVPWPTHNINFNSSTILEKNDYFIRTESFKIYSATASFKLVNLEGGGNSVLSIRSTGESSINVLFTEGVEEVRIPITNLAGLLWRAIISGITAPSADTAIIATSAGELVVRNRSDKPFQHLQIILITPGEWKITAVKYTRKISNIGDISSNPFPLVANANSGYVLPPLLCKSVAEKVPPMLNKDGWAVRKSQVSLFSKTASYDYSAAYSSGFYLGEVPYRPVRLHFGRSGGLTGSLPPTLISLDQNRNANPVIYNNPPNHNQNLLLYLPLNGNIKEKAFDIPVKENGRLLFQKSHPAGIKEGIQSLFFSGRTCLKLINHATLKNFRYGFAVALSMKIHWSSGNNSVLLNNAPSYKLSLLKSATGYYRLRVRIRDMDYDSSVPIWSNVWTKVAVAYDNDKIKFIVNGLVDYNAEGNPGPGAFFNPSNFLIGADDILSEETLINPFKGNLSDLKVWNTSASLPSLEALFTEHPPTSLAARSRSLLVQHVNEITISSALHVITLVGDTELKNITNQFSIFLEVNPVTGLINPVMIGNNSGRSFSLGLNTTDYKIKLWLNGRSYLSNTGILPNVWTRIAISYDGQKLRFFIGNTLDVESVVTGPVTAATTVFKIGAEFDNSALFRGKIKELALYNLALSPSDLMLSQETATNEIIAHTQFIDREVDNGEYSYFAQGIDIFGRTSAWSIAQPVRVSDIHEYSAPVNVKAKFLPLSAKVISATAENSSGRILFTYSVDMAFATSPYLSRLRGYDAEFIDIHQEKHLLEISALKNDQGSIQFQSRKPLFTSFSPSAADKFIVQFDYTVLVSWAWTGLQQVYNPEVSYFQIYMLKGALNELQGRIATVTEIADQDGVFDINVATGQTLLENELAETFINIENRLYKIINHSAGRSINVRIEYLGYPVIKPSTGSRIQVNAPATSVFNKDYSQVENWGAPFAFRSPGILPPIINTTTEELVMVRLGIPEWQELAERNVNWINKASVDNGAICKAMFRQFNRPTGTANISPADYIPSALTLFTIYPDSGTGQWDCYYLVWHEWVDGKLVAYCLLKGKDNEPVLLPGIRVSATTPARLYVGKTFNHSFETGEPPQFLNGQTTVPYQFAVTAGGMIGHRGDLSQKATIIAVNRSHPPTPPVPTVKIGKPDYYNLSLANISWIGVTECTYQLYRATDASVFTRDLEQRRKRTGYYAGSGNSYLLEHDRNFEDWFAAFKNKDPLKAAPGLGSRLRTLTIEQLFPPEINPGWNRVTAVWNLWAQRFYVQWSGTVTTEEDLFMRRNKTGPYKNSTPTEVFQDDRGFPTWFAANNGGFRIDELFPSRINTLWRDVTPVWRAWADRYYAFLEDEEVQHLAGLEGNESAFTLVNNEPINGNGYTEKIKGSVSNRYFYRLRSQGNNQLRSTEWGAVSNAQRTLLKSLPPRQPVFTKVEAGDRQVTLHWALNREPDFKEYLLYRAETEAELNDLRWWNTGVDPRIVAIIPDPRIVVKNGNISLPFEMPTDSILGVYRVDEFNAEAVPLNDQRQALNYYKVSATSVVITQLQKTTHLKRIANGVEVIIVYRTGAGEIRKLITSHDTYPYVNRGLVGLRNYYYKIISTNKAGIKSEMSKVVVGKALDEYRPDPPGWNAPELRTEGVLLSWHTNDYRCLIQRKPETASEWISISGWLNRDQHNYIDNSRKMGQRYQYRLIVLNRSGRRNKEFSMLTF